MRTFGLIIKRLLDLVAATILLVLFAPIFFVVAVAIKLDSSGPVFFRQERIGCGGRGFRIFKFRTMTADADRLTRGLPGDSASPLITSVGRHLRNYRIDELPQLLNVVRGEMSLVGPRPLVPLYAHTWTQEERKRLNMRPGNDRLAANQRCRHAQLGRASGAGCMVRRALELLARLSDSVAHALGCCSREHRLRQRWSGPQFDSQPLLGCTGNDGPSRGTGQSRMTHQNIEICQS